MTAEPTLAEQRRRLLEDLLHGEGARHRRLGEAIEPRHRDEAVPLSAEQNHVWLHASMAPDLPLYNETVTIHRTGSFDLPAFERALNEILRRHAIWRASFDLRSGQPRAVIHPELRLRLRPIDLRHLPPTQRDDEALRIATAHARQPFDLEEGPLLRTLLVRLADDEHRLYMALHHLIFDGVSLVRVMMPELTALYAAYSRGETPKLPEPRLQYADYAVWQQRQLATRSMSRELAYWRQKLAGDLPELTLPTDRPPTAALSRRGAMETFSLSPELTTALRSLSRQHRVTLYTALLAAFKTMLHRYSGQDDIVVGGITDMRRRPELENLMGYFLNGVALRTQPSAGKRFCDYLTEVQATVLEALDASDVPFDRVVREIHPRRDGRHPLFQVLFSIQPPPAAYGEGWALTQTDVAVGTAKFDLYFELEEQEDRILGRFLYSTDLFDAATIQRMVGHWRTLLHGVIENPQCTLDRLPLLSPEERRRLLVDRNATQQDFPQATLDSLIQAACRDRARQAPDAIAVECDGRGWRYDTLERRVQRLAHRLRRAGVVPGALVAIAMERSIDMVAGLLAILRAGGTYLPLDPALPQARLALFLEDARPTALLTQQAVVWRLPRSDARVVLYDDDDHGPTSDRPRLDPTGASPDVGPDDLVYTLYTSGSTARPKAVEIRHRSLVNLLTALQRDLDFSADDSFLAVTTLSFDIAALELFLPLISGGRLVLATREEAADPSRLAALFERSRCTVAQATPVTWRALIATGWRGDRRLRILCGGEALSSDLAASLLERGGSVWNMYGPTETTIWSLRHEVVAGETPVPIGRPLANTRIYILDHNGALVPDGVAGELCIGGTGLARGYRNDPVLTAGKFVPDPFEPGQRLYRTGDRVRCRADGAVEFLGRIDNQIKVRGFRVGLEEVEAAIGQHPGIAAAAARAVVDASGEASLVAYVVAHPTAGPDVSESDLAALRSFLRDRLPGYMVPTRIVVLPQLPTTPNGKIDRKRLPEPQPGRPSAGEEPRDDVERRLAGIWRDLLGLAQVGVHDNFFDLGGHSLLAYMLVCEIKTRWARELPLSVLFRSPTIAGLAEALRSPAPRFSHLVELRPGRGRPLFIVHGVFGNVLQLKPLAERMRTARPIYAIQARGADPQQAPHASIDEMAQAYLLAVRDVQPAGPYALAGYSFGGLIAFEMGCRLREAGEPVELLGLLETDLHERHLPWPHWLHYQATLMARVVRKAACLPTKDLPAYLASKFAKLANQLGMRMRLRDPAAQLAGTVWATSERHRQMFQIGTREFIAFRPRWYPGKLSLFRVTGPHYDVCNPVPIWRRAAESLDVIAISGEHDTIMEEPFVRTLAAALSQSLAAAECGGPTRQSAEDHAAPNAVVPYASLQPH